MAPARRGGAAVRGASAPIADLARTTLESGADIAALAAATKDHFEDSPARSRSPWSAPPQSWPCRPPSSWQSGCAEGSAWRPGMDVELGPAALAGGLALV